MLRKLPDTFFEELNWSVLMDQVKQALRPLYIVNDIDNEGLNKPFNDNVGKTEATTNAIADKLVDKLNNPDSREFYCKVAWKLSEGQIYSNLELALSGREPKKYFTWLCKRDMTKQR